MTRRLTRALSRKPRLRRVETHQYAMRRAFRGIVPRRTALILARIGARRQQERS